MNTNPCINIEERLTPFLLGDLGGQEAAEVRRHLEECEGCRGLVAELESTLDLLRDAMAADASAPVRLDEAHRQRIQPRRLSDRFSWIFEYQRPLAVAASLVVALGFTGFLVMNTAQYSMKPESASHYVAKADREIAGLEELSTWDEVTTTRYRRPQGEMADRSWSDRQPPDPTAPVPKPAAKPAPADTGLGSREGVTVVPGYNAYSLNRGSWRLEERRERKEPEATPPSEDRHSFAWNSAEQAPPAEEKGRGAGGRILEESLEFFAKDVDAEKQSRRWSTADALGNSETDRGTVVAINGAARSVDGPAPTPYFDGYRDQKSGRQIRSDDFKEQARGFSGERPAVEAAVQSGIELGDYESRFSRTRAAPSLRMKTDKRKGRELKTEFDFADAATEVNEEEKMVALDVELPKPMFVGTPITIAGKPEKANAEAWGRNYSGVVSGGAGLSDSPVQPDLAADKKRYQVQQGDTLSSIAQRTDTTVEHLSRLNEIADPNQIKAGASIVVPSKNAVGYVKTKKMPARKGGELAREIAMGPRAAEPVDNALNKTMDAAGTLGLGSERLDESALAVRAHREEEITTASAAGNKLKEIVIPSIDFRAANLRDVVQHLQEASVAGDPEGEGVDIVLNIPEQTVTKAQDGDYLGDEAESLEENVGGDMDGGTTLTLNLRRVTLDDAIRYVSEVSNLKYQVEDDGRVVISPAAVASGSLVTRLYTAPPSILDSIVTSTEGQQAAGLDSEAADVKQFFVNAGVPFPAGTTVTYNESLGQLVAANTPDNLEVMERILTRLAPEEDEEQSGPIFKAAGVNPYVEAAQNAFSTFSIDVDTAAYTLTRKYMLNGALPPAEAVRTEEFVNFFDYHYRPPVSGTFAVYSRFAPAPYGSGHLLKIGVKGKRLGREEQRRAVLTFVVDTSGSMNTPDRLGLLKQSLRLLVNELDPNDQVAIVQYGSSARLILEHTRTSDRDAILNAINNLHASGSTHLEEGLILGYELAARVFVPGAVNRVLLLSDGMANLGSDNAEQILKRVETSRRQGIFCSVFGFGIGTYNDALLETLANKGDGTYQFIDSEEEAQRIFVDELGASLNVIAKDVKIQVEFNPRRVTRYRQLGYENRQLKKEDFRDDTVDAGEVGSGQSVTALYEVDLRGNEAESLGTVRIRYQDLQTGSIEEIERRITTMDLVPVFEKAPVPFKLAAAVAEFSEILRGSPFAAGSDYEEVAKVLRPVALELNLDSRVQELLRLVHSANSLPRASE